MRRVAIESPCKGRVPRFIPRLFAPLVERVGRQINHIYAVRCMRDALQRGEAPYASHVLFDGAGVLDDSDPVQRALGINCGYQWSSLATLHVFYLDLGWSHGMLEAWDRCKRRGWDTEIRYINPRRQAEAEERAARDVSKVEA
jgi:hypothetical protein